MPKAASMIILYSWNKCQEPPADPIATTRKNTAAHFAPNQGTIIIIINPEIKAIPISSASAKLGRVKNCLVNTDSIN